MNIISNDKEKNQEISQDQVIKGVNDVVSTVNNSINSALFSKEFFEKEKENISWFCFNYHINYTDQYDGREGFYDDEFVGMKAHSLLDDDLENIKNKLNYILSNINRFQGISKEDVILSLFDAVKYISSDFLIDIIIDNIQSIGKITSDCYEKIKQKYWENQKFKATKILEDLLIGIGHEIGKVSPNESSDINNYLRGEHEKQLEKIELLLKCVV